MVQTIRHQFCVHFSLLFQMVCCILLAVLPFKTLLLIGPIKLVGDFQQYGFKVQHAVQNGAYHLKEH